MTGGELGVFGDPLQLAVIVGSTRRGRFAPVVANWFAGRAEQRDDMKIDVVDLVEFLNPPAGAARTLHPAENPAFDVREFGSPIDAADAFVVVTPECNHGYPGPLKSAIDSVHQEWQGKPVAFVSYGGLSGGLRAVEQLRAVFAELHTVTIRETVSFHMAHAQFDEHGEPRDPDAVNAAAEVLLEQLTWWADTLREGRSTRPYSA